MDRACIGNPAVAIREGARAAAVDSACVVDGDGAGIRVCSVPADSVIVPALLIALVPVSVKVPLTVIWPPD